MAVTEDPRPGVPHTPARWPRVGVVMPILNEERHLEEAVDAVLGQDYPGPIELVLALGPSRDRTDEIAHTLASRDPRVRTVQNPSGRTPQALNAALGGLSDAVEVVVRVDGHGVLDPDYIRTAWDLLEETGAANVGGLMDAEGVTPFERAVAAAMTSRLGVGSARFHTGGSAGPADTVYLGVFRKEWLDRMGGYDTRFVRAQDWELNHRIREGGGTVWFSPRLRVAYRPRPTLPALARQYRDYGRWRRVVARTHSGTINARYLAAPVALAGVAGGTLLGFVWPWAWLAPGGYLALTTVGGLTLRADLTVAERLLLPIILPTMHLSWGWGFLTSRVRL
ncbi:MAG TPA: glycosyltransferase family 2 protein [Pedococcus sp.]|nr:glycosyltransferase family 2 protein [Pedococcus sp.]